MLVKVIYNCCYTLNVDACMTVKKNAWITGVVYIAYSVTKILLDPCESGSVYILIDDNYFTRYTYTHAASMASSTRNLLRHNGCICPGDEVVYECTLCGGVATVWTGSLFNCTLSDDKITLRHSQFETASGACNNEEITASSVRLDTVNCSQCFVSQVRFLASNAENNKTILCNYFNGTSEIVIDSATVTLTTGNIIIILIL